MCHRIFGLRSYDTAYPVGVLRRSTQAEQNGNFIAAVAHHLPPEKSTDPIFTHIYGRISDTAGDADGLLG